MSSPPLSISEKNYLYTTAHSAGRISEDPRNKKKQQIRVLLRISNNRNLLRHVRILFFFFRFFVFYIIIFLFLCFVSTTENLVFFTYFSVLSNFYKFFSFPETSIGCRFQVMQPLSVSFSFSCVVALRRMAPW